MFSSKDISDNENNQNITDKNNENKKNIDIEGKMEDEFDKLWDEYDDDDELNEEPEEKNNENEENNTNYNYEYNNYYNHDNKYYGNKNYSYGPKKYSRKRKNNYYQKENEGYSNKNNQKYYFHEYSKINISNNYFMNTNKNYMKSEYNDNKNSYKEQNNIDKEEEDIKKPMFTNSKLQNNGNPEGNFIKINVDLNEQKQHINLINIGEVNINDKINNSILTMNKKEYDDKKTEEIANKNENKVSEDNIKDEFNNLPWRAGNVFKKEYHNKIYKNNYKKGNNYYSYNNNKYFNKNRFSLNQPQSKKSNKFD